MTTSLHLAVADAVRVAIDGESWSQDFTPATRWRIRFELVDLKELQVSVAPGPSTVTPLTRSRDTETYSADIVAQKQVDPDDNTKADELVLLMEEFRVWSRRKVLSANSRQIVCVGTEFLTPSRAGIERQLLEDAHVFNSALRTNWQITGAAA